MIHEAHFQGILGNFPKTRPPLPAEFQEIYSEHYKQNRNGNSTATGLAQKMESWMHRKIAEDVRRNAEKSTLEIGAGTLNHLPYEPVSSRYDIVEPFESLYRSSPNLSRIGHIFNDILEISADSKYDRIVSIAAFEHICNLPEVVAKTGLLLNDGGCLRIGIPSEGTILWKLGYTLTTGIEFRRRYGLDYNILMKHEHVNTAKEIEEVLRYFFSEVNGKVFGIVKNLSLYQFYSCRKPDIARCSAYLAPLDVARS
jgi:hypothetical protein